jgi:hypothetical protein
MNKINEIKTEEILVGIVLSCLRHYQDDIISCHVSPSMSPWDYRVRVVTANTSELWEHRAFIWERVYGLFQGRVLFAVAEDEWG